MPQKESAKKALRQNIKRKVKNTKKKRKMKSSIKEIERLIGENKKQEAIKILPQIYKSIDKASKTNVIKKNTASRKKSRLAKLISKIK